MKGKIFPGHGIVAHLSFRRIASLLLVGAAAVAFQGVAYAHGLSVTSATPGCDGSQIIINFTITSWDPGSVFGSVPSNGALGPHDGENANVGVFFNGAQVATGAFSDATNGDIFSGTANAPGGTQTVHVTAAIPANSPWGDGFGGGQSSNDFPVDISNISCGTTPPPGNGRFTGGGKVVVSNAIVPASGDVTLTKGFQVECDLDPKHETLELNWGPATHFHMDTITSAVCTKPGIPNPPTADVNRIDATGTGKYNGTAGYTVVFTLIDNGEPGTNDEAGFIVCLTDPANPNSCSTSTSIVLSVPLQLVSTGNIQAHLDHAKSIQAKMGGAAAPADTTKKP